MSIEDKTRLPILGLMADGNTPEGLYESLRQAFESEVGAASAAGLESLRNRWLGRRSGLLAAANENWLKAAPRELKPVVGRLQNALRRHSDAALKAAVKAAAAPARRTSEVDPTLPGPARPFGAVHPVRRALEDVLRIFRPLGYNVVEGARDRDVLLQLRSAQLPAGPPGS